MSALPALLRLGSAPRSRLALAAALGALTVLFGVGLMAMAGYLISRASERPAVLSLMVAIVAVRFFGLGRPIIRYLERLASHDVALRVLARVRVGFYERIEPLAPAQLDRYRRGDLLSRMVADVDALQNLYLRGLGPPLVALLAGAVSVGAAAAFLPAAGLVLAAGLLAGGLAVPALSGFLAVRAGRRQARARRALGGTRGAARRRTGGRGVRGRAGGAPTGRRGRFLAGATGPARRVRDGLWGRARLGRDRRDGRCRARGSGHRLRTRTARPRADRDVGAACVGVLRGRHSPGCRRTRAHGHPCCGSAAARADRRGRRRA